MGERRFRVSGDSWLDREWSSRALADDQISWDWVALQLHDGRDLMFYRLRGNDGEPQVLSKGMLVDADTDGYVQPLTLDDVSRTPTAIWTSDDDVSFPVRWRLSVPELGLDLLVEAASDDREMAHTVRYWEGAVVVSGSHTGAGYLELSGYTNGSHRVCGLSVGAAASCAIAGTFASPKNLSATMLVDVQINAVLSALWGCVTGPVTVPSCPKEKPAGSGSLVLAA